MKTLAKQMASYGIRVNAVNPHATKTKIRNINTSASM